MRHAPILSVLLGRVSLRHVALAPRLTLVLVLTVAVGVASFTSIRLANRAAITSFAGLVENLTGGADLVVSPPSGLLPDSALGELRRRLGDLPVQLHPSVQGAVTRLDAEGRPVTRGGVPETSSLVGIDLVGAVNLPAFRDRDNRLLFRRPDPRGNAPAGDEADAFWGLLGSTTALWISPALAREDGLAPGDALVLLVDDQPVRAVVAGLLPEDPGRPAPARTLLVGDLPGVRRLLGRESGVDRVDVVVEPGAGAAATRAALAGRLAPGPGDPWELLPPDQPRGAGETMTRAFRLNLTVLSLIALVVGLYLVAQGLDAAVARRRQELAVLRSLGVGGGTLARQWLAEGAAIGLAGGALGVLLGWLGAQGAVRGVARTVDALYQATTVAAAAPTWGDVGLGLAVGIVASVLAAALPARSAASTPPAQLLARGGPRPGRDPGLALACAGFALLGLGAFLAARPPLVMEGGARFPLAGYGAAVAWIVGASLVAAAALPLLGLASRPLGLLGPAAAVATRRLARPTGRHRLATAGLAVAIGMAAGMGVMIHSFEGTMKAWVVQVLRGDIFVSSAGATSASSTHRLSAATVEALAADPDVERFAAVRLVRVRIDGKETVLLGGDRDEEVTAQSWLEPPPGGVNELTGVSAIEPVWASESFTNRFGVGRGDFVEIPTPYGGREAVITGVYADFGNEFGSLLVARATLAEWFADDSVSRAAVKLRPGADAEAVGARWSERFPGLDVRTQAGLRSEVLRVFRQTFSVTWALQVLGLVVAVAGLGLALVSTLHEGRGELAALRAIGFDRAGIRRVTAGEAVGVAATGLVAGLALALMLGALLIHVINKQSFGWTLLGAVPWGAFAGLAVTVLAAAAAVGAAVGHWAAALPLQREE